MDIAEAAERLWRGDPSAFKGDTAVRSLGWVQHIAHLEETYVRTWRSWHDEHPPRHGRTVVLGMGGSSTPARMMAEAARCELVEVIDTSNPDTIAGTDFEGANVIAASKSGTTIETVTTLAWALSHGLKERDLTIITDPGTPLAQLAESLGARIFYGDPNTGGRFSALSLYGIVPAIAAGWSPEGFLATGFDALPTKDEVTAWFTEGAHLAMMRDHVGWLALGASPNERGSCLWLEQLVAETTGKESRGIIPVVASSEETGPSPATLVADIYRWHVRASGAAWALEVDPFNQPDVESAKRHTFTTLKSPIELTRNVAFNDADRAALESARYVALQVFGPLSLTDKVEALHRAFAARYPQVTSGLGPRFLHSTGQLHKGGPDGVVAVQVIVLPQSAKERISGRAYSFEELHFAQAIGDAAALRSAGRHVVQLVVASLEEVVGLLG